MPAPQYYQYVLPIRVQGLYSWHGPQLPVMPKQLLTLYRRSPFAVEGAVNGMGKIAGIATVQGVPSKCRVIVLHGRGLRPYGDVYSDPTTGKYRVYPLPKNSRYVVLTRDARQRFDAVIHDGILPVDWDEEEP
jgi:hypothetical protein